MLDVHKATLYAAGRDTGDIVRVTMAIDSVPLPNDEVPDILALALEKSAPGEGPIRPTIEWAEERRRG